MMAHWGSKEETEPRNHFSYTLWCLLSSSALSIEFDSAVVDPVDQTLCSWRLLDALTYPSSFKVYGGKFELMVVTLLLC